MTATPLMVQKTAEPAKSAITSKRRERAFFIGMALIVAVTVFAGFARTFYLRPLFSTQPLTPLLYLHGIVFTSWILLFLTQTTLVAANRTGIHRRLGIAGAVIAPVMVIVGTATAIIRANVLQVPPGGPPQLAFLTIPLGDMLVFGTLAGAAFYFRRRADAHKRLMLLATISMLPAAVGRLPVGFIQQMGPLAFFGLTDFLIAACALYDFIARRRLHPATLFGGLFIVISHPLRMMIGTTDLWLSFAAWLTR